MVKLGLFVAGVFGDVSEYYLIQNLTTNYDVNVRPVSDHTATVNVYIGLALSQIVDLVIAYFPSSLVHLPLFINKFIIQRTCCNRTSRQQLSTQVTYFNEGWHRISICSKSCGVIWQSLIQMH